MVAVAQFVRQEVRPGKGADVASSLLRRCRVRSAAAAGILAAGTIIP